MTAVDSKQFLAADVYQTWRRRVQGAESSVRIYSPYLDQNAEYLLGNARPDGPVLLSVLTDLSPESGARTYRNQLLALRRLIERGVEVRSLPRLHAKVLLVDGERVTVGSQNFTSYARNSRETTVAPTADLGESQFVETLEQWWEEGEAVDEDLLDRLLNHLEVQMKEARSAIDVLVSAYEKIEDEYREERRRAAARRFERDLARSRGQSTRAGIRKAARASKYVAGQRVAYASLQLLDEGYRTLMRLDNDVDLTRWRMSSDGVNDTVRLAHLAFYPVLLGPHGRMAFVRVAQSRITYVWRGVRWGGARKIRGHHIHLRANFPDHESDETNLVLTFGWFPGAADGYQLRMRFDGARVLPVSQGGPTGNPLAPTLLARVVEEAYEDEKAWNKILRDVLSPARNPRGFRNDKNAASFFPRGALRVDHTKVLGESVLLVQPIN